VKYSLQRIGIGGDEQTARVPHGMSVKCVCVSEWSAWLSRPNVYGRRVIEAVQPR